MIHTQAPSPEGPLSGVRSRLSLAALAPLALLLAPAFAGPELPGGDEVKVRGAEFGFTWDARAVEHLWNRAGFGVPADEIDGWVQAGPRALVEHLLRGAARDGARPAPPLRYEEPRIDPLEFAQKTIDERRSYRKVRIRLQREQFAGFRDDWVRRIVDREDPLRDRMTHFWHGVFTSSYDTVRHPAPIFDQHNALRAGALGSYAQLLRGMLRDPAMLVYLDNDENKKKKPNENLAREVMELFALGEGNYSEEDVREAARALTGAGIANKVHGGTYRFFPKNHDDGEKTILGETGAFGPEDLATILLAQPACASFVARSIIEYLEGVPADAERVERYARSLRDSDYDVAFMLRRLLLDPAFYRDEVIGARIASPLDFLAGALIRMDVPAPGGFVAPAAASMGEDMFRPPNVKGWDGGMAWITTSNFMMRGNFAGVLLGEVDAESIRGDALDMIQDLADEGAMGEMSGDSMMEMGKDQIRRDEVARLARQIASEGYLPAMNLTRDVRSSGARTDGEIAASLAERLMAVEPPAESVRLIESRLVNAREALGYTPEQLLQSTARGESILREISHFVLSMPESQIH